MGVSAKAQTRALTENGRQVILFNDGTWKYENDSAGSKTVDTIVFNPGKFYKKAGATFTVKSNVTSSIVNIDPNNWTFSIHHDNEVNPEYRFTMKSHDGFAVLITEKTQIGLNVMVDVALINARKAAYNARITKKEYRMVNDKKMLYLEMSGTIKGIDFKYMGYYYSSKAGTTQLLCYTSDGLYNETFSGFQDFLNGLSATD
jgi:hypothetical protein